MKWSIRNQNGTSDFCHYGVKGMKWGVRKDKKHKKKYSKKVKIGIAIGASAVTAAIGIYGSYKLGVFDKHIIKKIEKIVDEGTRHTKLADLYGERRETYDSLSSKISKFEKNIPLSSINTPKAISDMTRKLRKTASELFWKTHYKTREYSKKRFSELDLLYRKDIFEKN